jgi:hypothetical protein
MRLEKKKVIAALAKANSISPLSRRRTFSFVPLVASAVMRHRSAGVWRPATSAMAPPTTKNAPPGGVGPMLKNLRPTVVCSLP